jgi:ribonuclease Z
MKITILGNNSALPAYGRYPTSQAVTIDGDVMLIDCGEATQIQMQRYGIKWRKMEHIFISHLHGDHYFGLPGLINSMGLLGRALPLHVYAAKPLDEIFQKMMNIADTSLPFELHFHALVENESKVLVDNSIFKVTSFPVEHRIPCHGFKVEKKSRGRKILLEKCREYAIPNYFYERLKQGEDYERADGYVVMNEWVTDQAPQTKKYAYCADTIFTESFLPFIKDVDTLYHESTYLEQDAERAALRFHSTAKQAATIAQKANSKQLLLGHFSSRYKDLNAFAEEAKTIFPNSFIAEEGMEFEA